MKSIKHNSLNINVGSKGHFFLTTEKTDEKDFTYCYINTNVTFGAGAEAEFESNAIMPTEDLLCYEKTELNGNDMAISYGVKGKDVCITEKIRLIDGLNVIRQRTEIVNRGNCEEKLSRLSSACVTGIGIGGSEYF